MATVFQNPFPVPHPFDLAHDPGNITGVPVFSNDFYTGGPSPVALPAIGPQAATFHQILGGVFPRRKK